MKTQSQVDWKIFIRFIHVQLLWNVWRWHMNVSDVHIVRTIHSSTRCWKAPFMLIVYYYYYIEWTCTVYTSIHTYMYIVKYIFRCWLFDVIHSKFRIYAYIHIYIYRWYWTENLMRNVWTSWNASLCYSWFLFHNNMLIIRVLVLIPCNFFLCVRCRFCCRCWIFVFFLLESLYTLSFDFTGKYMMFLPHSVFSTISPTYAI